MTRAYQEMYLSNAQSMLGEAFDYAVNDCHIPGETFGKLFVASSVSKRMENGEPNFLAGKSGADMVSDILMETTGKAPQAGTGGTSDPLQRILDWLGNCLLPVVLRKNLPRNSESGHL